MTNRSNFANKSGRINMAVAFNLLKQVHPKVCAIIEQVRSSEAISDPDKDMILDQLISLCGTLNTVKSYALCLGRWKKDNVYSDKRAELVHENELVGNSIIQNETIFTVVSCRGRKSCVVYIDLPIDVAA